MTSYNCEYYDLLKDEFAKRIKVNTRYSLRSFAKTLDLNPGLVQFFFEKKRIPTQPQAEKIVQKLGWDEEIAQRFIRSIMITKVAQVRIKSDKKIKTKILDEKYGHFFSDPNYMTLLNLTRLKHLKKDLDSLAKKIELSTTEVKQILDELVDADLINHENNEYHYKQGFTNSFPFKSEAIREGHLNDLELAKVKLMKTNLNERVYLSTTLVISTEHIEEYRVLLSELLKKVSKFTLDKNTDSEGEVYRLGFYLFPLT